MNRIILALATLVLALTLAQSTQAAPPKTLVKCATHAGVKGYHCHDPVSDAPVDPVTGRPIDPTTGKLRA